MATLKVLPDLMTQNIMIRDNTSRKIKRYLPKTFMELVDYAKSDKWEFDHDSIDLYFLELNPNYDENESDSFEKTMLLKPTKYTMVNESENWSVYRLQFTHTDESVIFLPGHYKVLVVNDNGAVNSVKRVDEVVQTDRILCRVLDNVIISQSLFSIENRGVYSIESLIELEVNDDLYLSIGNSIIQVLVNN
jgi:hypothetical protein